MPSWRLVLPHACLVLFVCLLMAACPAAGAENKPWRFYVAVILPLGPATVQTSRASFADRLQCEEALGRALLRMAHGPVNVLGGVCSIGRNGWEA